MRVIVITGMSGSGKSTAVRALEDEGYYCIDNLPVRLFKRFVDLVGKSGETFKGIVLVADIRGREFFKGYESAFHKITGAGHSVEIFYFDALDDILLRRFSETRRRHPADEQCSVAEAIRIERDRLSGLRQIATRVIDTSEFTIHQLKELILRIVSGEDKENQLVVEVQSFGFKYGVPLESSIGSELLAASRGFGAKIGGASIRSIGGAERDMSVPKRADIRANLRVALVQKQDQRTGKQTIGIVKDILTSSPTHPHGIKVRLTSGQIGRVQAILDERSGEALEE